MIITIHLTGPEIKDEKEETVPECSKVDTGGNGKSKMQRPRFWKTPASWKSREALMECEHCGAQRKGGRENIFSSVTFVFQVRVTCSQHSLSPRLEWYLYKGVFRRKVNPSEMISLNLDE